MYKILNVLVATLAIQAVLTDPVQNQQEIKEVAQELLQQIRIVANDASNSIQNLQVENQQGRHALISEANELAHHIHQLAYHVPQIVKYNQNGKEQQNIQEIENTLDDVVHAIQEALQDEPSQLQSQLKTQIQNVVVQAERLAAVAQQQQESEEINDELLVVLDDLIVVFQQVHVRNSLQSQDQEEIKNQIQVVVKEVSDAVQNINSNDTDVPDDLAYYSHHLAHHLDEVIHELQAEVYHQEGEVQNVIGQVINKLRETRVSLDQAQQDSPVSELKSLLKTNINNIGAQIERLVEIIQPSSVSEQVEAVNLRDAVHRVVAHSVAAARQLQRNVEDLIDDLVEDNQES